MSRFRSAAALTAAAALLLTGCASSGSAPESSASGAAGDGAFPITITHALGETTIKAQPERVATVGWSNQDVALALGIVPVGTDTQVWNWTGDADPGLYEWSQDKIDELGGDEPALFTTSAGTDFEAIADTTPDVILAAQSGLDEESYATLSEIAPVVAYPDVAWFTSWRDTITLNAEGLGLKAEGEQLVADLEAQIADATADSDFAGKTAAFFSISPADLSSVSLYTSGDARTAFLGDLGFDMPQAASEGAESGSFYEDFSAENADRLSDVDVLVTYGDGSVLAALQADPLWSTIPAVKNGAVIEVGMGDAYSAAVSPTALSIPWVLERYVGDLDAAAAKVQ
ncbi:iron-siderophore ABC transporter substrate-binding protein [Microbacterium telephonicum]|uniref:Iron complex transport system substrate-binding protein n=1 Tax=Microbacterium telephonicum TaxID=1714841 RepID=A0A498CBG8_9MICO|nr:iron-siderophore ABC transporter substrate-binding protein [Microbacterium telephonicum]RLK49581.1 iron complex transport system substrate-binding protein [Microbacterium telephonicum]